MVLQLPVHKFGVLRYPYFSTPTGAPGPGPYTVPSVVGPGPNSARARVAWVALLLNFVPAAPSPGGARLSRRRGGRGVRGVRDVGGVRGAESRRHASRRARFLYPGKGGETPVPSLSGGRRGGAVRRMNGVEARLSGRPLPTITGWGEVTSPVASALRARHVAFMHLGSRRWRQGTGPTRVEVVGRPQSPALPPL